MQTSERVASRATQPAKPSAPTRFVYSTKVPYAFGPSAACQSAGALTRYAESLQTVQAALHPENRIADHRYEDICAACLRGIAAALRVEVMDLLVGGVFLIRG